MRPRSLVMASALAFCLTTPALAQQSTSHLYMSQFKITPMPRRHTSTIRKIEPGQIGRWPKRIWGQAARLLCVPARRVRRFTLLELPDEASARAAALTVWATGNLEKLNLVPLITAEDWKAVMEKAKQNRSAYTPPTETKSNKGSDAGFRQSV